ncbi:biotin transporter BioY [Allorhizobium pseudoryzae]|uniref:biotin transporter BioY n=1 Tax=Allorhizobium pseudoryzae TaxID=379684 RepID=UPI003D076302
MSLLTASQPPLIDTIPGGRNLAVKAAIAVAGSVLLAISAKLQVPFYPVPVTMQTLVVLVLGMTLGSRLAFATLALYLAEGLAGLPVFAGTPEKGIGLAYMMGPTGGYLLGYLIAATLTGWLAERGFDRSLPKAAFALILGNIAIYVPGVLWLGAVIGWDKPVLAYGLIPFLAGDALKLALGACLLPLLRHAAPGSKR